jgi:hypothetical protein
MKRSLILMMAGVVAALIAVTVARMTWRYGPAPAPASASAPALSGSNALQAAAPSGPARPSVPAERLPDGWENFRSMSEPQQLNRVTAAMENHALPADVLAFFEKEIFNRRHWAVTRNNMANALVWQESPNPNLHELFARMLEDATEDPVWRDYCLQFLSECLKSTSDAEAVKAVLSRYSKGKDGLAGTAIVNLALQEGEGRVRNDESFSRQIEAQLADAEVSVSTRMSILGVIGKRKDERLLPVVRDYAASTNDGLRRCAIAALGQIGVAGDLALIEKGLTDRNRAVRLAAKAAEGRLQARLTSAGSNKEQEL